MLGAGVFVVWAPAARAAGSMLLLSVVVAGAIALVNALSVAQLAARYPSAGGAYTYGRAELGPTWGFVAGIGFVMGKTASVAAIALTVGHYVWPSHAALAATIAIVAGWSINAGGVTRTAAVATAVGLLVLVTLAALSVCALAQAPVGTAVGGASVVPQGVTVGGVFRGAALVFFAFAGYARVATLGEEVRRPRITVPRAIVLSLGLVLAVDILLATALLRSVGNQRLASSAAPVGDLASLVGWPSAAVVIVAAVAAGGSLVAVMAGIGRTAMAMAREGDMPRWFAPRASTGVPMRAEAVAALASIALVSLGDLGFALAMSSCAVLTYYAIANIAAIRQNLRGRARVTRVPVVLSGIAAAACIALVAALPWPAVLAAGGAGVGAVAVRWWALAHQWRRA